MRPYLLPMLLSAAAMRVPRRIAVIDQRRALTYEVLEREANQIARTLYDAGVRRGDRVGLFLDKSVEAVAGIYGIMKVGAAYVPLDPFAPPVRLAYIIRDCGIEYLVTGWEKARAWHDLAEAGGGLRTLLALNEPSEDSDVSLRNSLVPVEAVRAASDAPLYIASIDQDLAYILYTSGSTGKPKGVMLSHLNALAYVTWCVEYFQLIPEDVLSNHAPLHFDLTILDLYAASMAGAAMVVVPPEVSVFPRRLAAFIQDHRITVWYSVPSVLTLLALYGGLVPGDLETLRHVIFAGEVFPTKHLRTLMALVPDAQFTNLYGPTETNVCTYYRVPPLSATQVEDIPIGRAIDNVEVIAVDDAGKPVGPGEVGELLVRGTTVAYGYWGDADRTAKSMPTNPIGPSTDRIYRTGDLVKEQADGNLLFLGRKDHQIKSRGYRIELGEIETALHAHPAVAECAVVAIPDDVIGNRLKAFVVSGDPASTDDELARFCATRLPRYMIPETFEFVTALPRTSTNKVDRRALVNVAAGA